MIRPSFDIRGKSEKKIKFSRIVVVQCKITALTFNLIVYSKEGRGARLDKLILCSLKLLQYNKKTRNF